MVLETQAAGSDMGFDASAIIHALQSPQHVVAALQGIGADASDKFDQDSQRWVADVVSRLRIAAETAPLTNRRAITIRFLGDESSPWATALVNRLAGDYVASLQAGLEARAANELAAAEGATTEAERKTKVARASLDEWLDEHLLASKSKRRPNLADEDDTRDSPVGRPGDDLRRQLSELQAKREALLDRLTLRHPDVKAIELEIADVRRNIDQRAPSAGEAAATPLRVRPRSDAEWSIAWDAATDRQWRTLGTAARDSDLRRREAAAKAGTAAQTLLRARSAQCAQVVPAGIAPASEGRPVWKNFVVVVAVGLLAASAATWGWPKNANAVEPSPTIESAAEFEAEFGIPVVGVVRFVREKTAA
jgi:hypothetical protein